MTITVATCDGCDVRFRHADEAFVLGIQSPGTKEFIFHVCMSCASRLADNDRALDDRIMATALKRMHGGQDSPALTMVTATAYGSGVLVA